MFVVVLRNRWGRKRNMDLRPRTKNDLRRRKLPYQSLPVNCGPVTYTLRQSSHSQYICCLVLLLLVSVPSSFRYNSKRGEQSVRTEQKSNGNRQPKFSTRYKSSTNHVPQRLTERPKSGGLHVGGYHIVSSVDFGTLKV